MTLFFPTFLRYLVWLNYDKNKLQGNSKSVQQFWIIKYKTEVKSDWHAYVTWPIERIVIALATIK
jgi:hypothetical protein